MDQEIKCPICGKVMKPLMITIDDMGLPLNHFKSIYYFCPEDGTAVHFEGEHMAINASQIMHK